MSLWVVENGKIALQIAGLERRLRSKGMILSQADHKPLGSKLFDVEVRMPNGKGYDSGVYEAVEDLLD